MNKELELLTQTGYASARDWLVGTKDELPATFTLLKPEGGLDVLVCPWPDDKAKREMIFKVCVTALKEGALGYSFVSEMWFAQAKLEGPDAPPPIGLMPRDRPDRREAVIVLAGNGTERKFSAWEIIRDTDGACTSLSERMQDAIGFESWIADALDRAVRLNRLDTDGTLRAKLKEFLP